MHFGSVLAVLVFLGKISELILGIIKKDKYSWLFASWVIIAQSHGNHRLNHRRNIRWRVSSVVN